MRHCPRILLHLCLLLIPYSLHSQSIPRSEADSLLQVLSKSNSDSTLIRIYLRLGEHFLYKPKELTEDLDSAIYYAQAALNLQMQPQDSFSHTRGLILLAEIYKERGDFQMVKTYQQKAIPEIETVENLEQRAVLWSRLGDSYGRSAESMPDKIKSYEEVLALYRQLGNSEKEALTLKYIADMHQDQGEYAQSLRELLEVLRIQQSIGLKKLHETYDLLGHVYARMGNYELALPYALDAIKSAKATADTTYLVLFYQRVGQMYLNLNQYDEALKMYSTLVSKLLMEPGNQYFRFRLAYIRKMSQTLIVLKKPQEGLMLIKNFLETNPPDVLWEEALGELCLGEAYMGLQDYVQAEKHLVEGLAKATSSKGTDTYGWVSINNNNIIEFHSNLTNLYLATGQVKKALLHLNDNFPLIKKQPDLLRLSNFYLQAFKLDSVQGNLSSAITHYQQYKKLQDSVFNERKSNQLIAYQVQHETEAKEQDLKLKEQSIKTLTQEKHLQQEKIEKEKLLRNGFIGGAILLLLLLGVIYNRYRLKQQNNRLLQAQQSRLQDQHQELRTQQASLQEQQQQINQKNQALEQLLTEKERLLQEIHHRVKNNLQIVMSLLNSQVASLQDKVALSAIQDSQNRVQAMALIHQKLYQAEGVARIPMKSYIEELVDYLQDSYADSRRVDFNLFIGQIEFDVNIAVPLGLIINEAITNAFKYAFPGERSGSVYVGLVQRSDTSYELTIEDDGVGLPESFDPSQSRSLGMTLMHGFSAQLGAELSIEGAQGVKISLTLTDEKSTAIYNKTGYDN